MVVRFLKYAWVSPATFLGLIPVALTALTGGSVRRVSGAIEAWGGFSKWFFQRALRFGCALTIGHVIIGVDEQSLNRYRNHEHVHVEQYEKWGILFIPLYLGSSLLAKLRGKHCYHDNVFEREAYDRFP